MSRVNLSSNSDFLAKALLANVIAIDTETNGGDIRDGSGFCVGISGAVRVNGEYYTSYFPVAHFEDNISDSTKQLLFQIMATRDVAVMHNAKFDITSLKTGGYTQGFIRWYCTMMMCHFLNENIPKGLDWLAKNELRETGKIVKNFVPIWKMRMGHMIPVAEMFEYACQDTVLCLKLFYKMHPYFVESGFDGSEMPKV